MQSEVADHEVPQLLQISVVPHPLDELEHHVHLGPEGVGTRAAVSGRDDVRLGRLDEASDVAAKHFVAGHRVGIQTELQRDGQRIPDYPLFDHASAPVQTVGDRTTEKLGRRICRQDQVRAEKGLVSAGLPHHVISLADAVGKFGNAHQAALDHLVTGG